MKLYINHVQNTPISGKPPVFKTEKAAKEYFNQFQIGSETRWVETDVGFLLEKTGSVESYGSIAELELHHD